jgi:hypothetical protein
VELVEGMLFVELAEAVDGWLWRNGRIDSMLEVVLNCFGKLMVKKQRI